MNDLEQKKATRNMVLFLFGVLVIGGLLVAFATNFLAGKKTVSISCSDPAVIDLLKTTLIKANSDLSTAQIAFNALTTLEDTKKGRQIKCRTSAEITFKDESEKNNYVLDYSSTIADDNASMLLVIDKITKIEN